MAAALNWKTSEKPEEPEGQVIDCVLPTCNAWLLVPRIAVDQQRASGIAQVMGVDDAFFANQAAMANARRVETALGKHLSTHTVEEWVPALAAAQAYAKQLEVQLQDVLRVQGKPAVTG